jgi:hypothetical protein
MFKYIKWSAQKIATEFIIGICRSNDDMINSDIWTIILKIPSKSRTAQLLFEKL